jgi:hypothetical protein
MRRYWRKAASEVAAQILPDEMDMARDLVVKIDRDNLRDGK